jgi:hypothetical protein
LRNEEVGRGGLDVVGFVFDWHGCGVF